MCVGHGIPEVAVISKDALKMRMHVLKRGMVLGLAVVYGMKSAMRLLVDFDMTTMHWGLSGLMSVRLRFVSLGHCRVHEVLA